MTNAPSPTSPDLRKRIRRAQSSPSGTAKHVRSPSQQGTCQPIPHNIEALDLSSVATSPAHTLASIRFLVLSYLEELENQLADVELPSISPDDVWTKGETTMDDARQWVSDALDMLSRIRQDVRSHLPDLPHVPTIDEMRSHLPDIRSTLLDVRSKLDEVFHAHVDFHQPLSYIPTLSAHMQSLHSHLSSMELPAEISDELASLSTPNSLLSELLDALINSDLVRELTDFDSLPESVDLALRKGEDMLKKGGEDILKKGEDFATAINNAIKRSFDGMLLISYSDLPVQWRNNPYVIGGYRFIPLERWPLIVMSLVKCHNETLNIHTHLIPCVLWAVSTFALTNGATSGTPELLFMGFALLCLFCSSVWHTMAGCAHHASMEFCARVDYVGIGWLISASVGTVVHYGFQCYPRLGNYFLGLCFLTGLAGNIFPFMKWFNDYQYRQYRVLFFLSLAFSSLAPLFVMGHLHSRAQVMDFISPVIPSLVSYIVGLVFYVSHAPERWLSKKWATKLDAVGVGSHCIWHLFIVLAVRQHRAAIRKMVGGLGCEETHGFTSH